ncbi:MAG TPA: DUF1566 domain-containing protein [Campylobacterales bacterium]|nr:DUF1566 domain-containing protein [Campylobacterales bacterium]HHS92660.1 DUF1566 domain-containing protein [Campylobacterales bacterium]
MKDFRGEKETSSQTKDTEKVSSSPNGDLAETNQKSSKWNPKIYRGERSYTQQGSDKVKDNYTGLIWQRKGSNGKFTHPEAEAYCKRHGMRLPTIEELYYLADVTQKDSPKIDNDYFDIKADWYWSSTPYRDNSDAAWVVYFNNGLDSMYNHTDTGYVLCVSGQ